MNRIASTPWSMAIQADRPWNTSRHILSPMPVNAPPPRRRWPALLLVRLGAWLDGIEARRTRRLLDIAAPFAVSHGLMPASPDDPRCFCRDCALIRARSHVAYAELP